MAHLEAHPAHPGRRRRGAARRASHPARHAGLAALLLAAAVQAETLEGTGYVVHFPPGARAQAERVAETFARRQARAAEWLGLEPRGRVVFHLVADHAEMLARAPGAPEWAVAVTRRDDVIVLRLDRVDRSPTESLDLVLTHELVHQVLNHLGGPPLPRWFEEGLCVHHTGVAYLEPDTSLERTAAAGHLPAFADADELFSGNGRSAALGYKLGQRAVRDFVGRFGDEALRRLLRAQRAGRPFPDAFREGTGMDLAQFEAEWRRAVTPRLPFWLFVLVEDIELTLLFFGALLVALGYLRWRLRRGRALAELGEG